MTMIKGSSQRIRINGEERIVYLDMCKRTGAVYQYIRNNGKNIPYHRYVWFLHHGQWPEHQIDHINGNTLDNRIENLRDVSQSINVQNSQIHRAGKPVGIGFNKAYRKWSARLPKSVTGNSCYRQIGLFETQSEAVRAMREYIEMHYPEHKDQLAYLRLT